MPDIDFQRITLNCIPNGDMPSFYASQYENGRPFIADIFWGDEVFTPGEGCWAEIDIRKVDGNLIVLTDDVDIDSNAISVQLPQQAVTCIGKNLGQIKIWAEGDEDDICIATLNFWLEVQPDPLACGVTSESDIDNLESQIAAIVPEVLADDYYTKDEVDALLPDMTDYYTKIQVNRLLSGKVSTAELTANYYNKTEVDGLFSTYDTTIKDWVRDRFATKSWVNNQIFNILPVGTVGPASVASFDTEIAGASQKVVCTIEPAQSGSGTPSPNNPRPLIGYTGMNVTRAGVNLLNPTYRTETSNSVLYYEGIGGGLLMKANQTYVVSVPNGSTHPAAIYLNDYSSGTEYTHVYSQRTVTFTPTADCYVKFNVYYVSADLPIEPLSDIQVQCELGSTATAYEAYNGTTYPITWTDEAGTIYGGTLDVTTGTLTKTHGFIEFDGSNDEDWGVISGNNRAYIAVSDIDVSTPDSGIADIYANMYEKGAYSGNGNRITARYNIAQINIFDTVNVTSISDWRTFLSNNHLTVCYELATPVVYSLTPEQIMLIAGTNNVNCDTGNTTVMYKDSIQHYVDNQ